MARIVAFHPFFHILEVHQHKLVRISVQQFQGIGSPVLHPVHIHLKTKIRSVFGHVVKKGAILVRPELIPVRVIREGKPRFFKLLTCIVKYLNGFPGIFNGKRIPFVGNPGTHNIGGSKIPGIFYDSINIVLQGFIGSPHAGNFEAVFIQQSFKLIEGEPIGPSAFEGRNPPVAYQLKAPLHIAFKLFTQAIQLNPYFLPENRGSAWQGDQKRPKQHPVQSICFHSFIILA